MSKIGLLYRFARQLLRLTGERDAAFLQAIDALGDGERLHDILFDDDDRRPALTDARQRGVDVLDEGFRRARIVRVAIVREREVTELPDQAACCATSERETIQSRNALILRRRIASGG